MPLIDLQTNLKNLRFGNDQPGYGSSGLPYIQTQIPNTPNATGTFKPMFRPGSTGNLDYPIRGGQLEFQLGSQTFTLSSQVDKTRIKKFFEDKPRGTAFIQKQIGLQLSNPKIETGNTLYGIPQAFNIPGLLENTRVYNNGQNTLAQVGASGTGAHAIRHGLIPFNAFQKQYYDIVNAQNVNDNASKNRLLILSNLKMSQSTTQFTDVRNVTDINTVNTLGISLNKNLIFQYLGGPGSAYGIGTTTIRRAVDTTRLGTKLGSRKAMVYDQLRAQQLNNITDGVATTRIQDFRDQLPELTGSYVPWGNNTIDKRFYVAAGSYKDKMNLLYPFAFKNDTAPWEINGYDTDDLIKFVFEAVSNDDPSYSTAVFFRAFLLAGLTDNNSAQLNGFKYLGRGENFYTYQGFDRTISLSFRVAAGSKNELRPMYNRLNTLLSQVYPDYSPVTNIMRAPLIRMTVGDYLYRVPGFLESVNFTIDNNTPWDINLDGDSAQLPQVVDVNISFKPIMDVLPRRSNFTTIQRTDTTSIGGEEVFTDIQKTTEFANTTPLIANIPNSNEDNRFIKSLQRDVINSVAITYMDRPETEAERNSRVQSQNDALSEYLDSINNK